jgi:hypothetical protein
MIELNNGIVAISLAPEVGGRMVRFVELRSGYDFLWRNARIPLRREEPGVAYDPNFYGGIDELLPNDIPETIAGVDCPDHGEMWTTAFEIQSLSETSVFMRAALRLTGFEVDKSIQLVGSACEVTTRITNVGATSKPFLWKLHAALAIEPGDRIPHRVRLRSLFDRRPRMEPSNRAWRLGRRNRSRIR